MKKLLIIAFIFFSVKGSSQIADSTAIKATAMDYAEGFYAGDEIRMERAIHPDFNKASPIRMTPTSGLTFNYSSYSALVELTRGKVGLLEEGKRKLTVSIINVNNEFANVRVNSSQFNDYLQLLKIDDKWKIVNVLWTNGLDSPMRLKGFDPLKENDGIKLAAKNYIEGVFSGDAKQLETVVFSDFSKLSYNKLPKTGKLVFTRRMYSSQLEAGLGKLGFVSENQRNYQISVLDVMEGMALVEIATPRSFDYLQMYKDGDKWKVFHSLVKPNSSFSFISNLPPSIGQQMPDFTLPIYQGGDFTLSRYKGKNILVIFPRGWIGDHWCQVCHYQYAELLDLLKDKSLLKKYNLEVVYVMPYSKEKISDWVTKLPDGLKTIEDWKKPQGPNADFANYITANFPSKLEVKPGELSIPILVDSERTVSKRFQLFTNFWDGIKSEQNIPTIFIVDKNGKIQFKYHSQTTFDRPNTEYLINQMSNCSSIRN